MYYVAAISSEAGVAAEVGWRKADHAQTVKFTEA